MANDSQGPSLGRQAFSAVAWLSVLNGLGGLGMVALAWWLNRTLPDAPIRMGQWSVVLSLMLMTSLIFEGGITAVIQQRKDLERGALSALAWLQLALGLAGAGCLYLAAEPVARLMTSEAHSAETADLIRWSSAAVIAIAVGLTPKGLLQRDLQFRTVASIEGGSTLITVVLAVLLAPRMGVHGLVLAMIGRHVVETAFYWSLGAARPWTLLRAPEFRRARGAIRDGTFLGMQSILGTLVRQGDVLLIGALAGTVQAGVYRQIQQLVVQPHAKLTMYVSRAAFPALSRVQDEPERFLRGVTRMQRLLALCVIPMQFGLAAVAPRLLGEFLGEQYRPHMSEAIPAMMLLCLGAAISSYAYSLIVALNAAGRGDSVLGRQAVGSAAMLGLMAAGAPFGLVGIAAGRVAASMLHASLVLDLAERAFRFGRTALAATIREALPASAACFAAAAIAGALWTRAWPASTPLAEALSASGLRAGLAAQVACGAAVYAITLLALRFRPREEWRALRS